MFGSDAAVAGVICVPFGSSSVYVIWSSGSWIAMTNDAFFPPGVSVLPTDWNPPVGMLSGRSVRMPLPVASAESSENRPTSSKESWTR